MYKCQTGGPGEGVELTGLFKSWYVSYWKTSKIVVCVPWPVD